MKRESKDKTGGGATERNIETVLGRSKRWGTAWGKFGADYGSKLVTPKYEPEAQDEFWSN